MKLRELLKEYTDDNWTIPKVKPADDAELKQVKQMFSNGMRSQKKAMKNAKDVVNSDYRKRMGRYAPMFVHVQYHVIDWQGVPTYVHQTQYYNSNYPEEIRPRITKLHIYIKKEDSPTGNEVDLGSYLVSTDEYIKDLKKLKTIKSAS
jgi:hypothetical protein